MNKHAGSTYLLLDLVKPRDEQRSLKRETYSNAHLEDEMHNHIHNSRLMLIRSFGPASEVQEY